jgi:uncharacterized membrane protein
MSDLPTTQSTGLAPNVAGALAYVLGPLTGVIFLVVEKENRFVRFHAAQSIVIGVALIAVSIALSIVTGLLSVIPILGFLMGLALSMGFALVSFVLWIVLMYRAFQGQEWVTPVAGAYAQKIIAQPAVQ